MEWAIQPLGGSPALAEAPAGLWQVFFFFDASLPRSPKNKQSELQTVQERLTKQKHGEGLLHEISSSNSHQVPRCGSRGSQSALQSQRGRDVRSHVRHHVASSPQIRSKNWPSKREVDIFAFGKHCRHGTVHKLDSAWFLDRFSNQKSHSWIVCRPSQQAASSMRGSKCVRETYPFWTLCVCEHVHWRRTFETNVGP